MKALGRVSKTPIRKASKKKSKSVKDKIDKTLTEEIVIGICSSIGSLRDNVIGAIENRLIDYKYEYTVIKLSDFIAQHDKIPYKLLNGHTPAYSKLKHKIDGGNRLRKRHKNSVLAEFAISEIYADRMITFKKGEDLPPPTDVKTRRKCYIIDSIKNTDELHLLRRVYRDIFYFISVFSPLAERKTNLLNKGLSKNEISKIIDTDEFETIEFGQKVRDTFIEADFFIRASDYSLKDIKAKVERYFHLIFNSKVITPFINEIAMYQAKSSAGNSACLSRQVGAAITDANGDVISKGWNDVPKFGGNLYREDSKPDMRCKESGICSNDLKKDHITNDIIDKIIQDKTLRKDLFQDKDFKRTDKSILHLISIVRRSTKVKDLIEFSRSVHAEMHAIIIGSQLSGSKMVGGKLFTTTYPCHNCARHIIVAGIKEIYFIEPYTRSLCLELHSDALSENEEETNKVLILVYDGVAPRRFLEFFSMNEERKEKSGIQKKIKLNLALPKSRITLQALPTLESQAIHSLQEAGLLND